jgi:hypothetical protein
MSTYTETEADLPQIIEQIKALAQIRDHRVARQLTQLDRINLKAAQSLRSYLNRRPDRADRPADAHLPDIAAQVERATAAATAAVHGASSQRASATERIRGEEDEGYYLHDGRMYKVATSQYGASQGHLFARRLNEQTGDWDRAPGMTSYLRKSERVTLEVAVEFGRQLEVTPQMALYGRCWICKRVLTDEESIKNKVGPGPHIGIDA